LRLLKSPYPSLSPQGRKEYFFPLALGETSEGRSACTTILKLK